MFLPWLRSIQGFDVMDETIANATVDSQKFRIFDPG
jgi:hypothetical protein